MCVFFFSEGMNYFFINAENYFHSATYLDMLSNKFMIIIMFFFFNNDTWGGNVM